MHKADSNHPAPLAILSAGITAALVPQYSQAALVTVGGDGGTGTVTLSNPGDATNLGGVLVTGFYLESVGGTNFTLSFSAATQGRLFNAIRSSVSGSGTVGGHRWEFNSSGSAAEGAVFGSSDNWVPGHFRVAGVNSGNLIWGWLQVELNPAGTVPTIINFTYDDAATDTTAFAKPVGGFSVSDPPVPVPVPVLGPFALGLSALALGASGVLRRRRARAQAVG